MIKLIKKFFRKPRKRNLPYQVNYHENWLLPPLALFVGIFIVLYAHRRSFGEAIWMLDFYKAAIPSVLAAWLMMGYIVRRTYQLDDRYPWAIRWWRGPWLRLLLQLWHGVAVPGFAVLLFYAFYFTVRGHALRFWRYVDEDFPFVLLMLLGFNVLIWVYYRLRTIEIMRQFRKWRRDYGKSGAEMEAQWRVGNVDVVPEVEQAKKQIALVETSQDGKGTSWVTDMGGKREKEYYTMKAFYKKNKGDHFFKITLSMVVNRAAIREVDDDGGDAIVVLGKGRPGERITVTVRRKKAFVKWF